MSGKGYAVSSIQERPREFDKNDTYIFEGLCRAILTRQANWASVEKILPALKIDLFNYEISKVAVVPDKGIKSLYHKYKSRVKARFLEDELISIRYNAEVFEKIIQEHGSVWQYLKSRLNVHEYDSSVKCYIRPQDKNLVECFIDPSSAFKLSGVRLAICCEFFNNIGIDEFKPDVHTISFLNRINLDRTKVRVSRKPDDVRGIGITIAQTLEKPRKYVDGHIWCFCAEDEGEICAEDNPKCDLCKLNTEEPRLCTYCDSSTMPGAASLSHKGMKSIGLGGLTSVNKVTETSQTDSNSLAKEVEMNLPPGTRIIVDGEIGCPDKRGGVILYRYKKGPAKGSPRFEIVIVVSELRKMISAFRNHYTFIISTSPKDCKYRVGITLVIGQSEYIGKLCVPPSRLQDLQSNKPLPPGPQYREPWISATIKDKNGLDNNLVRALELGGFESEGPVKLGVLRNKIWVLKP